MALILSSDPWQKSKFPKLFLETFLSETWMNFSVLFLTVNVLYFAGIDIDALKPYVICHIRCNRSRLWTFSTGTSTASVTMAILQSCVSVWLLVDGEIIHTSGQTTTQQLSNKWVFVSNPIICFPCRNVFISRLSCRVTRPRLKKATYHPVPLTPISLCRATQHPDKVLWPLGGIEVPWLCLHRPSCGDLRGWADG